MKLRTTSLLMMAAVIPGVAMLGMSVTASATIPTNVAVYGGSSSAAGVYVIEKTTSFSSFGDGAVNNRYPLAAVGQESAPASHAVASPADYGPLTGTVLASDPPQPLCPNPLPGGPACIVIPFPPHQAPPSTYANAQYPNPPGKGEDHYTSGGSDQANAAATELSANANGTYGGSPGAPFNNSTAEAHTIVNPDGSIHTFSHSHVGTASFGAFVIRNVDVVTDVVSAGGVGHAKAVVNPGVIDKGDGKPQAITPGGQGTTFTVPGAPGTPPITVRVYAVSPENATKGDIGSICATGTQVEVDQPVAPGVPSHDTKYILGDGCSEGFVEVAVATAAGSAPVAVIDSSGNITGDAGGGAPSTTTTSFGNPGVSSGFTGAIPSTIIKAGRAAAAKTNHRRLALVAGRIPLPWAAIFFLWEALVLGAAASLVWARQLTGAPK